MSSWISTATCRTQLSVEDTEKLTEAIWLLHDFCVSNDHERMLTREFLTGWLEKERLLNDGQGWRQSDAHIQAAMDRINDMGGHQPPLSGAGVAAQCSSAVEALFKCRHVARVGIRTPADTLLETVRRIVHAKIDEMGFDPVQETPIDTPPGPAANAIANAAPLRIEIVCHIVLPGAQEAFQGRPQRDGRTSKRIHAAAMHLQSSLQLYVHREHFVQRYLMTLAGLLSLAVLIYALFN